MRQFAIADIHGHLKTFEALLARIGFTKADELFLLGDFIDRGPDSKGVIDCVEELKNSGHTVHCLRGNHEQMVLDAEYGNDSWRMWLRHGGKDTCISFGTQGYWFVPDEYRKWMAALPLYLETEGYLFVHAGLDFSKTEPLNDPDGLLWARNWTDSLNRDWLGNRIIVHGHTPVPRADIELNLAQAEHLPVIDIDNGCYARSQSGKGHLCALELGGHRLSFQPNIDVS